MSTRDGQSVHEIIAAFDRHDQRRRCGVPTVSVLVGPPVATMQSVRQWANATDRSFVIVRPGDSDPKSVVVPWVNELAKSHDLRTAAVRWLARRLNRTTGSLEQTLRLMTPHEVATFLDPILQLESETSVERIGRNLIECWVAGTQFGTSCIAADLDLLLKDFGRPWTRVVKALGELVSLQFLPILVLSATEQNVAGLEGIASLLAELAAAQPRAVLALMVEPTLFDSYIELAPASRAKALLRDSVITLPRSELLGETGSHLTPVESHEFACGQLIVNDPGSRIVDLQAKSPGINDDDQARSAAERFLFESLESLAETNGLFELNATLDFHFGPSRWIEVDLLARALKIAVEIDGYHHFQDLEAFRRDRRKGLALQKHGYLVVRVLADDVVQRLEEVMDTVVATVAFRRTEAINVEATS
jgi:Protein of unknown function (DUF559)